MPLNTWVSFGIIRAKRSVIIKDGPYPLTSSLILIVAGPYRPGVGHIDPGPYRLAFVKTGKLEKKVDRLSLSGVTR